MKIKDIAKVYTGDCIIIDDSGDCPVYLIEALDDLDQYYQRLTVKNFTAAHESIAGYSSIALVIEAYFDAYDESDDDDTKNVTDEEPDFAEYPFN